jgi:hypothetical protein
MRQRMLEQHASGSDEFFDIKHDRGGLIDVEFIVQYLILGHAHQHARLCGNLGNIALLGIAAELGLIPAELAEAVRSAYREYRRMQHVLRLNAGRRARVERAGVGGLRFVIAGGDAGADGPDRFIGDHRLQRLGRRKSSISAVDLRRQHAFQATRLTFGQRLTDADDRRHVERLHLPDLLVDRFVGLAEVGPLFGVADDDEVDTDLLQHVGADLAGEGTLVFPVHVLRSELDIAALDDFGDRGQREVGRRDGNDHLSDVARGGHHCGRQLDGFGNRLVHFPVAGDNDFTHGIP